jgi:hypothetical protein
MMFGRFLVSAMLAIGISTHSIASILLSGEQEDGMTGRKDPISIWVTPNRMRIDNGDWAVIYLPKEKISYFLVPSARKYFDIDLPVDQGQGKASEAQSPHLTITKTGKTDKVGGWTCQELHVTAQHAVDRDLCVVPLRDIGITDEDLDVFQRFARTSQGRQGLPFDTVGLISDEEEIRRQTGIDGFAVREVSYNTKGKPALITTYSTVEHKRISAKTFEIPAGYTKIDAQDKSSPSPSLK